MLHSELGPSDWVMRWAHLIPAGGRVLDVASGSGRHARWLAGRGHAVDAVDRDAEALSKLASVAGVRTLAADIENGRWPYLSGEFDGVVVTNYLHRPLFPELLAALAPGGVLIYETFAQGNERYGRPSTPEVLLRPGELLELLQGQFRVIAYEDTYVERPKPALVQRVCGVKSTP